MDKFKDFVLKENMILKQFSYKRERVSLKFSLEVDNKKDCEDFIKILQTAKAEIEEELRLMN
jgi:hypothetical protein